MCYSANAISDFQTSMITQYGNLAGVNKAWGTSMTSQSQITPPTNGNGFFTYAVQTPRPQYAIDFVNWYNSRLIQHGQAMLNDALIAFGKGSPLGSCTLEIKIPGVTWTMGSNGSGAMPRSAEICAGLIPGSFQQDVYYYGCGPAPLSNANCGQDYAGLLQMVYSMNSNSANKTGHFVQLYFTCLEQPNMDYSAQGWSWPATLVYCVGQESGQIGLTIKGENALAPNTGCGYMSGTLTTSPIGNQYWGINTDNASSSNTSAYSWSILQYALANANYQGVTILRVENLTTLGQTMYGNWYGLIYCFNKGNSNVPSSCPQISQWNVGPANTN